jgi:PPOX class probable F420-dependent enzyme
VAHRRDEIRMDEAEVARFLEAGRTLHVASIGPDGAPHLVPMWYAMVDGRIAFWTYGRSQKVRNIRRDPRVTCLVEAGDRYEELRGVMVKGRAVIVADATEVRRVGCAVHQRHRGTLTDDARAAIDAQVPQRVAVLVDADEVVSWDHRK